MKTLADARLYGIVDLGYVAPEGAPLAAQLLLEGGVDILQLRAKGAETPLIAALGREIHPLTSAAGVPFILNDHPALLGEVPAEGVHVGQDDLSVAEARAAAGREVIVGKSTHSLEQAMAAEAEGADYIGFGPLFATPTKPGREAVGLDGIVDVHRAVSLPVFCIGGIKPDNLPQVRAAGARRVVIVSAWLEAADLPVAVREVRTILEGAQQPANTHRP